MRFLPSLKPFLGEEMENKYMKIDCLEVSQNGIYCIIWNNEYNTFYLVYDSSQTTENEQLMLFIIGIDLDE